MYNALEIGTYPLSLASVHVCCLSGCLFLSVCLYLDHISEVCMYHLKVDGEISVSISRDELDINSTYFILSL